MVSKISADPIRPSPQPSPGLPGEGVKAISEFDLPGLERVIGEWGCKPSHAGRILLAYYGAGGELDPQTLTLGKVLREKMSDHMPALGTKVLREHRSGDGTVKLLVGLGDGQAVESVLMPGYRKDRAAGCVSSQVGCAMGCDFCASGRGGLSRNLTSGEIVEQFLHLSGRAKLLGRRLASLVFMGMGEPLHNPQNVTAAIERICHPRMGNLGWRNVTVSTVGIVPGIDALAEAKIPVCLAISLHAPDDATRSRIVPINRRWPVAEVMAAAKRYQARTGRITNVEYCLMDGVNDSDEQAIALAELMRGFNAHVNVIPHNWIGLGISGVEYRKPAAARVERFVNLLRERQVVTHIRVARGDDVSAACGQLRERNEVDSLADKEIC